MSITFELPEPWGNNSPSQQGYHVKLTVDTGQGAGKHKVFWVECKPRNKKDYKDRYSH